MDSDSDEVVIFDECGWMLYRNYWKTPKQVTFDVVIIPLIIESDY